MVRVIYITGSGRSGSTLLNALLGSVDSAIGVGELAKLPHSGWMDGEYCACGETVNQCPVWSQTRESWSRRTGATVEDLATIQRSIERTRFLHRTVFGLGGKNLRRYSELVGALYETIAEVTGSDTIIDASKNPLRAIAMKHLPGIDLRLIHLVRDARGVAWSLMKRFAKDSKSGVHTDIASWSPMQGLSHWLRINLFAELAMLRMPTKSRLRVRYEDLMTQPAATVDAIGEVFDLDIGSVVDKLARSDEISFGHMVAGNRVRMRPGISIKPDFEWRETMAAGVQRKLWAAAWPLMRRYDYAR